MKLVGVSCGPNSGSKTFVAVQAALEYVKDYDSGIDTEAINVCTMDVQFCDARDPGDYTGETKTLIDKIIAADALIFATPMYRGSYTSVFKNVFDLLPNDAIFAKPVGLIATGGSFHHYLALEHELKPVFGFFMAFVLPGVVYMTGEDFEEGHVLSESASDKLRQMAEGLVNFQRLLPKDCSSIVGAPGTFMPKTG